MKNLINLRRDLFTTLEIYNPMQLGKTILFLISICVVACTTQEPIYQPIVLKENFQNKGHQLIYKTVEKVGNLELLRYGKKDVIAMYKLDKPEGKSDITLEKYIFEGELSYGKYYRHDYTMPELTGQIVQGNNGDETWMSLNHETLNSPSIINEVASTRSNNYYWFTVLQKLLDPDLFYHHLGTKTIDSNVYDVVEVMLDPEGIKSSNQYHVYINKKTGLVDQLVYDSETLGEEYGPRLIQLEYESIDGVYLPNKRRYKKSNWNAEIDDSPWTYETWYEVSFNNELTKDDFTNPEYFF